MVLICRICIRNISPDREPVEPLSKYRAFGWNLLTGQILACFPDLDLRIAVRNPLVVCAECANITRAYCTLRLRVQESEKLLHKYMDLRQQCREQGDQSKFARGWGVDLAAVAAMFKSVNNPEPILIKKDRILQCLGTGNVSIRNNAIGDESLSKCSAKKDIELSEHISPDNSSTIIITEKGIANCPYNDQSIEETTNFTAVINRPISKRKVCTKHVAATSTNIDYSSAEDISINFLTTEYSEHYSCDSAKDLTLDSTKTNTVTTHESKATKDVSLNQIEGISISATVIGASKENADKHEVTIDASGRRKLGSEHTIQNPIPAPSPTKQSRASYEKSNEVSFEKFKENNSIPKECVDAPLYTDSGSHSKCQQTLINESLKTDPSPELHEIYREIPYTIPRKCKSSKKRRRNRLFFQFPKRNKRLPKSSKCKMPLKTTVVGLASITGIVSGTNKIESHGNDMLPSKNDIAIVESLKIEEPSIVAAVASEKNSNEDLMYRLKSPRVRKPLSNLEGPVSQDDSISEQSLAEAMAAVSEVSTENACPIEIIVPNVLPTSRNTLSSISEHVTMNSALENEPFLVKSTNIDAFKNHPARYGRRIKTAEWYSLFTKNRRLRNSALKATCSTLSPEGMSLPVKINFESQMAFLEGLKLQLVSPPNVLKVSNSNNKQEILENTTKSSDIITKSDTNKCIISNTENVSLMGVLDSSVTTNYIETSDKDPSLKIQSTDTVKIPGNVQGSIRVRKMYDQCFKTKNCDLGYIPRSAEEIADINQDVLLSQANDSACSSFGPQLIPIDEVESPLKRSGSKSVVFRDVNNDILLSEENFCKNFAPREDELLKKGDTKIKRNRSKSIVGPYINKNSVPGFINISNQNQIIKKATNDIGRNVEITSLCENLIPTKYEQVTDGGTEPGKSVPISVTSQDAGNDVLPSEENNYLHEIPSLTTDELVNESDAKIRRVRSISIMHQHINKDRMLIAENTSLIDVPIPYLDEVVNEDISKKQRSRSKLVKSGDIKKHILRSAESTPLCDISTAYLDEVVNENTNKTRRGKSKSVVAGDVKKDIVRSKESASSCDDIPTPTTMYEGGTETLKIKPKFAVPQQINEENSSLTEIPVSVINLLVNEDGPKIKRGRSTLVVPHDLDKDPIVNKSTMSPVVRLGKRVNKYISKKRRVKPQLDMCADLNETPLLPAVINSSLLSVAQETMETSNWKIERDSLIIGLSLDGNKEAAPLTEVTTSIPEVPTIITKEIVNDIIETKSFRTKSEENINTDVSSENHSITTVSAQMPEEAVIVDYTNTHEDTVKNQRFKPKSIVSTDISNELLNEGTASFNKITSSIVNKSLTRRRGRPKVVKEDVSIKEITVQFRIQDSSEQVLKENNLTSQISKQKSVDALIVNEDSILQNNATAEGSGSTLNKTCNEGIFKISNAKKKRKSKTIFSPDINNQTEPLSAKSTFIAKVPASRDLFPGPRLEQSVIDNSEIVKDDESEIGKGMKSKLDISLDNNKNKSTKVDCSKVLTSTFLEAINKPKIRSVRRKSQNIGKSPLMSSSIIEVRIPTLPHGLKKDILKNRRVRINAEAPAVVKKHLLSSTEGVSIIEAPAQTLDQIVNEEIYKTKKVTMKSETPQNVNKNVENCSTIEVLPRMLKQPMEEDIFEIRNTRPQPKVYRNTKKSVSSTAEKFSFAKFLSPKLEETLNENINKIAIAKVSTPIDEEKVHQDNLEVVNDDSILFAIKECVNTESTSIIELPGLTAGTCTTSKCASTDIPPSPASPITNILTSENTKSNDVCVEAADTEFNSPFDQYVLPQQAECKQDIPPSNLKETIANGRPTEILIVISDADQALARTKLVSETCKSIPTATANTSKEFSKPEQVKDEEMKSEKNIQGKSKARDKSKEDVNENLIPEMDAFVAELTDSVKVLTDRVKALHQEIDGINNLTPPATDNGNAPVYYNSTFLEDISNDDCGSFEIQLNSPESNNITPISETEKPELNAESDDFCTTDKTKGAPVDILQDADTSNNVIGTDIDLINECEIENADIEVEEKSSPLIFEDPVMPTTYTKVSVVAKSPIKRKRKDNELSLVVEPKPPVFDMHKAKVRKMGKRTKEPESVKLPSTPKQTKPRRSKSMRLSPFASNSNVAPQTSASNTGAPDDEFNAVDYFLESVDDSTTRPTRVLSTTDATASGFNQTLKEFWADFNTSLESPGKLSQDQFIDGMCLPEVFAEVTLPYLDAEQDVCVDGPNLDDITSTLIAEPKVISDINSTGDVYFSVQEDLRQQVVISVPTQFDNVDTVRLQEMDSLCIDDILRQKTACPTTFTTSETNACVEYIANELPNDSDTCSNSEYLNETDEKLNESVESKALTKPIPVLLSISGKSGCQSIKIMKVANAIEHSNLQQYSMDSYETMSQSSALNDGTSNKNSTIFQLHDTSCSPNNSLMWLVNPDNMLKSTKNVLISPQSATTCDTNTKALSISTASKVLVSPDYKHSNVDTPMILVTLPNSATQVSSKNTKRVKRMNGPLPSNSNILSTSEVVESAMEIKNSSRKMFAMGAKIITSKKPILTDWMNQTSQMETNQKSISKSSINHGELLNKMPKFSIHPPSTSSQKLSAPTIIGEPANDFVTEFSNYISKDLLQQQSIDILGPFTKDLTQPKPLNSFTSVVLTSSKTKPLMQSTTIEPPLKPCKTYTCELCRIDFALESCLLKHKEWHSKWGGLYRCTYCAQRYDSLRKLQIHTLTHGQLHPSSSRSRPRKDTRSEYSCVSPSNVELPEVDVLCPDCGQLVTVSMLPFHLDWHDPETPVQCTICTAHLLRMDRHMHLTDHHYNDTEFICTICAASYTTKQTLCWHLESHSTRCRLCGGDLKGLDIAAHTCPMTIRRRLYERRKYRKMLATFRNMKVFRCKSCSLSFYSKQQRRMHSYRMHKECDQCGEVCFKEIILQAHKIKVHRIDINAQFMLCTRTYKSNTEILEEAEREIRRASLGRYAASYHAPIASATSVSSVTTTTAAAKRSKKITCDICGRVCRTYAGLSAHQRHHRHPAVPEERMGRTMAMKDGSGTVTSSTLEQAQSFHSVLPLHKLPQEKRSSPLLITNETTDDSDKTAVQTMNVPMLRHICKICDMKFDSLKQLTTHITIHTGIENFNCSECEMHFFAEDELQGHEIECHPPALAVNQVTGDDSSSVSSWNSSSSSRTLRRTHACHCGEQFLSLATLRKHKVLKHQLSLVPQLPPNVQAVAGGLRESNVLGKQHKIQW